jgi:hypothetical protein
VDWSNGVESAWTDVVTFLPKLAVLLVVLLVGYVIAKALAKVADRVLERVGFDRAVERGGVRRALARSPYDASDLVGRVVFYGLMLLVLQLAFSVFGPNPVSDLISDVLRYVPMVLVAIVIVVVAAAIAGAARELVRTSLGGLSYGTTLANVASIGIVTVGVFAALSELEIAPMIVNGLFYAVLAVLVGSAVVAIGGGGIVPMRQRWERALTRYDEEKPVVKERVQAAREEGIVRGEATTDLTASSDAPIPVASSDARTTRVPTRPSGRVTGL